MKFCVVDIETTGGGPRGDRITEIAMVALDHGEVTDRWSSLVNPGQPVTPFVVQLTGIHDSMLKDAPDFASVWPEISRRLQGRVFVAHNVSFDYGVLQREATDIGAVFQYPKLCTVRLSRKLLPSLSGGHSLGNLVKALQLSNKNPHRALGDAVATASLLQKLSGQSHYAEHLESLISGLVPMRLLPTSISPQQILDIPESPGVFRLLDHQNQRLYVGVGANLNRIVCQWFWASNKGKKRSLRERTAVLDWDPYSWELIARLEAEQEIDRYNPPGNTSRRFCGVDGFVPAGYYLQQQLAETSAPNIVGWDGEKVLGWIHKTEFLPQDPGVWPDYWTPGCGDNLAILFKRWMKRKNSARRIPWKFA